MFEKCIMPDKSKNVHYPQALPIVGQMSCDDWRESTEWAGTGLGLNTLDILG